MCSSISGAPSTTWQTSESWPAGWAVSPVSSGHPFLLIPATLPSPENLAGQDVFHGPVVPLGVFPASQTIKLLVLFVVARVERQP